MNSGKEKENEGRARVFQALLSAPGMQENCKLQVQLSRLNILLACALLDSGISGEGGVKHEIMSVVSTDSLSDLQGLKEELLHKGGLSEFYEKLKTI